MTGRTHDLGAFTALHVLVATQPIVDISMATAIVTFGANFFGGLAPDIDQPTADFWQKIRGGSVFSRFIAPFFGGHRFLSHSLLGVFLWGIILWRILLAMQGTVLVDMNIVWYGFMSGYVSHLLLDMLTLDGVPWLFPLPFSFGIPPFRFLRIKTGGFIEKTVIFPCLIAINVYLFSLYSQKYIQILESILR